VRTRKLWIPAFIGAAVFAGVMSWSSSAEASGISAARFGGEHGHPTTDNATAIYYNPAGIALSKGTHIFVDGTLALRWASYDRPAIVPDVINNQSTVDLAPGANSGKATLFNAIAAPFFGATSDFGTDFIYGGLALYFPFGGSAVWDKNPTYDGSDVAPGAVDGVQRWYSIDGTIRSMYITGALGFNIRQIGLSLGVSGSAIRSEIVTIRARNVDGTDDVVSGDGSLKEGRSYIDANGWQGGFGIGAVYDVMKKGFLWLGVSYTSQPNVVGGMTLEGTLDNAFTVGQPERGPVEVTQTMPDIVRLGVRWKPTQKSELRLFADYTRWSVFDKQCVLDATNPDRSCEFTGAGSALDDPESFGADEADDDVQGVVQHLPRFWKDAGGVRLGGSYWFLPQLETYVGVGYDSTAIPLETMDPALIDMHKMTLSIGARWQIIRQFALALTSTQVIFFPAETNGDNALNVFQAPTRQPSGEGEYRQFFQLFNVYADIAFGMGDGKGRRGKKDKKGGAAEAAPAT
jgi:long-chain fatty acid transport protein